MDDLDFGPVVEGDRILNCRHVKLEDRDAFGGNMLDVLFQRTGPEKSWLKEFKIRMNSLKPQITPPTQSLSPLLSSLVNLGNL